MNHWAAWLVLLFAGFGLALDSVDDLSDESCQLLESPAEHIINIEDQNIFINDLPDDLKQAIVLTLGPDMDALMVVSTAWSKLVFRFLPQGSLNRDLSYSHMISLLTEVERCEKNYKANRYNQAFSNIYLKKVEKLIANKYKFSQFPTFRFIKGLERINNLNLAKRCSDAIYYEKELSPIHDPNVKKTIAFFSVTITAAGVWHLLSLFNIPAQQAAYNFAHTNDIADDFYNSLWHFDTNRQYNVSDFAENCKQYIDLDNNQLILNNASTNAIETYSRWLSAQTNSICQSLESEVKVIEKLLLATIEKFKTQISDGPFRLKNRCVICFDKFSYTDHTQRLRPTVIAYDPYCIAKDRVTSDSFREAIIIWPSALLVYYGMAILIYCLF